MIEWLFSLRRRLIVRCDRRRTRRNAVLFDLFIDGLDLLPYLPKSIRSEMADAFSAITNTNPVRCFARLFGIRHFTFPWNAGCLPELPVRSWKLESRARAGPAMRSRLHHLHSDAAS